MKRSLLRHSKALQKDLCWSWTKLLSDCWQLTDFTDQACLNLLLAVVAVVVKLEMLLHVKEFKFLKAIKGKMETGAALAFGVMRAF